MAESIRARCRVRYTCSVDVIDERLREAMVRSLRLAPPPMPKGKKRRNAAPTGVINPPDAVISLPAASTPLPEPQANETDDLVLAATNDAGGEQPRSRGRRGRRGGKKAKKTGTGGTTALAFSDGFDDNGSNDQRELVNTRRERSEANDHAQ
jgi:hypothetical protein